MPFLQSNVMKSPGQVRKLVTSSTHWLLDQYMELAAAMRFLSVLPLPANLQGFDTEDDTRRLRLGSGYFPVVGLALGLLLWLLILAVGPHLPSLALAALLVVALVLLTGGLHLDGLMDTCDGLFGGITRERKLEIMRDSRVGSFGVLGAICVLLLKWAFFASLGEARLVQALVITLPCARWAMVLALRAFPSARAIGLGMTFRQTVTLGRFLQAGITALIIALVVGQLVGALAWVVATLTALAIGAWVTYSLGGLTGDIYGAIEEITEVVLFLLLVLLY
jgi:adenosylcobinamide-GDP ribazoletransferase